MLFHGQAKADETKELSLRQQSIIPIASFAATGDIESLKKALNHGLESGLSINEIKEILVQVYAYAGFPRSLNAITAFMDVLEDRKKQGIQDAEGLEAKALPKNTDKLAFGEKVQTELMGAPNKAVYQDFSPAIGDFLKEHLFADIFGRGVLTYQEREIATIAMLSSMKGTEAQLRGHLNVAMNIGFTAEQLKSLVSVLRSKIGRDAEKHADRNLNIVLQNRK
jgi:alkylhydroperoxidase/carboxymuconolactone decarboxylase family protein YurZ